MRIVGRPHIDTAIKNHPDLARPLHAWTAEVEGASWKTPLDITSRYPRASILPGGRRVIFRIKGNRYRLIAVVEFVGGIVRVRWIGTHAEYDRIDANTV